MATGRKTGGKDFAAGQSGNPAGRPPEPEILKQVKRLTKAEIAEVGAAILDMTVGEIKLMAKDDSKPMLHVMLAGMAAAAAKGSPAAFDKLLDRLVGKQKDRIEVSGAVAVRQRYDSLSDAELDAKLRAQTNHITKLLDAPAAPSPSDPKAKPATGKGKPAASPGDKAPQAPTATAVKPAGNAAPLPPAAKILPAGNKPGK